MRMFSAEVLRARLKRARAKLEIQLQRAEKNLESARNRRNYLRRKIRWIDDVDPAQLTFNLTERANDGRKGKERRDQDRS